MKIIPTPKLVQPAIDCAGMMRFEPAVEKNMGFQDAVNAFALYVKKIYGISVEERDRAQSTHRLKYCTLYAGSSSCPFLSARSPVSRLTIFPERAPLCAV